MEENKIRLKAKEWASQVVLEVKNLPANAVCTRDIGFDPWFGKIAWNRKWQPFPGVAMENSMARVWRAIVHGVAKSRTLLSTHRHTHTQKV